VLTEPLPTRSSKVFHSGEKCVISRAGMNSEEFHALLDEYEWESEVDRRDSPLTLARLAKLERQKGVRFPAFYKEFLSMYGAGDFGSVIVMSPDPRSQFPIWETTSRFEDREFNFMGVVERDSDYFGFLIEQGVCANDIGCVTTNLGTKSARQTTQIFLISLPKWV
jgi:hypothetical protein